MKDYVREARRLNLSVYGCSHLMQSYSINRHANYVRINYFDGTTDLKDLDKTDLDDLDKKHERDFVEMKEKVVKHAKHESTFYGIMSVVYFGVGVALRFFRSYASGVIWLTGSGYYFSKASRPWRLKKDIQLTGWIYDHRKQADKVIQSEVLENVNQNKDDMTMTNNARMLDSDYPYEKVPYSKEMYDEGINLNNINDISYRDMKKLKRKVLRLERRNNNA